ncbi:FAD-binding protein [Klebsiella pneumoniae]
MTDEQRQHAVAAIQQALPALEWTLQPAKIKRLSRDFHWFSPLLTEQLAGKQADAVVRPRDEEELRQLVCACAQHQLPLTLRGSATGNYGQLVPLEGGLLVDMTGLNQIVALGNGTVRAQAGIRLADIETAAHAANIPLEVLHRVAAMASGGMDTLPHNGAVITLLAITGLSHRQAYGGIFAITVIKSLAVLFVIATFYVTGIV